MAEGAVTFLLEKVKDVVKDNKDLLSDAENEYMKLNNELNLLKAIVKDLAKPKKKDHLFRELERQIREVVYEVEDAMDTCLTKAIELRGRSFFYRWWNRSSLAKEIKSITAGKVTPTLDEAKGKYEMVKVDESESMEDPRNMKKRDEPIRQKTIVGLEDEEATITSYLMQETERLDVIPIIGMSGQGKTTLAWKIYENESICFHFPVCIWVNISKKFKWRDVFLHILRKFTPSEYSSKLEFKDLAETVRACLERERFLLVLDDVWSSDDWNQIKEALPLNNGKAKVVITSRARDVGRNSTVYTDPHELRLLNQDESWRLLQYEVYGNLEDCPPDLRGIGEQIAVKCDGLPLKLLVVAGALVATTKDWKAVLEHLNDTLETDVAQRITDAVDLSYERLPDDLRECFLYLGMFPQDYDIPAKMLFRLWISEGFILPKEGRSLEERAEENLNYLINRNLLKVKTNLMGKAKTCRVPQQIRAFCISKSKEENLFQVIKYSESGVLQHSDSEVRQLRRICLHRDPSIFLSSTNNSQSGLHVRSFLCFNERPLDVKPEHISAISSAFTKMKILESTSMKFPQFPAEFSKLFHLRYLTLFVDDLKVLPQQISQLWNLQTLIIETKSRYVEIKANMWRMIRLRHLKTKAAIVLDDSWEGEAGQNLQTLSRLSPKSCTKAVYTKATNLRTLGISGDLAKNFDTKFLGELHNLENLKLTYEPAYEGCMLGLHQLNCFPPHLKKLTLTNTFLDWQHMSALALIKSLEVLKLKENAFIGVLWKVAGYSFPSLQLLLVVNTDLVIWDATAEAFPSLRFLVVKKCGNLKEIPESIGGHLEKLELDLVRHSVVESARKIAEEKGKTEEAKFGSQFNLTIGPNE